MTKDLKDLKVDLSLLNKLTQELAAHTKKAESIRESGGDNNDYILELSRAAGVASGITQEATMLIGDYSRLVQLSQPKPTKDDVLSFLTPLKGVKVN